MPVVVYTRSTCAPCRTLKNWLEKKGVKFEEMNVDENPELMNDVIAKSGYQMVPMTVVGGQTVSGLNLSLLSKLLML